MFNSVFLGHIKLLIVVMFVSISICSISLLGTHAYEMIAIIITIVLVMIMIYIRLKEGLILSITLICTFIPQIYSLGFKIGAINISVTDCVLCFNYFYLFLIFKVQKIQLQCTKYKKILIIFLCMTMLLFLNLSWSILYNDFGLALKLVRTPLYAFFIYLLCIVSYEEKNVLNYIIFLGIIVSIATVFTYLNIVKNTGEYALFRNSETFISSALCYLIITSTFIKLSRLKKTFIFIAIVSLIGAIVVEQDRVQIIAVLTSLSFTILFLLFKRILSIKKIIKITFFIILLFAFIYLTIRLINNQNINNMFKSYYTNRIEILFNDNGNLQLDTSLNFRQLEYQDIIKTSTQNLRFLIFGKGLGATYLGDLTVVDSFWFWVILNLGLIGLIFFAYLFFFMINVFISNITPIESAPIFAYFCATFVMTLTTPNMIYRVDDSVSMGILLGLIHLILKNNQEYELEGEV